MAYYSYYQSSQPTWGTQQYQFMPPPMPKYQPQPSWHGGDYYRAHADTSENTLFDYVWSKVRNIVTGASVPKSDARRWWKAVYGGLANPVNLLPRELGAAAGFEAARCWEYHRSIYVRPLSDDREREKEALIGLATAEATRLWTYTQRPRDKYGHREASEVAAATASRIVTRNYNKSTSYDYGHRHVGDRRRSFSDTRYRAGSNVPDIIWDDDGDDDDDDDYHTLLAADTRNDYLDLYSYRGRLRDRSGTSGRSFSAHYRRSLSPRYTNPTHSSAAVYPGATYDPTLGSSIYGSYYPNVSTVPSPYYLSYPQLVGTSPYSSRTYTGSSVGLPPPPGGPYLTASDTHHRARSTGSYGAVRPTFGY